MLGNKGLAVDHPTGMQTVIQGAEQMLWFPRAHLMLLCFLMYFLFVKVYMPLLYPLAALGRLIFSWVTRQVTGFVILCHFSQQMSSAVHFILLKKLWKDVLAPTVQILWSSQAALRNICFYWVDALQSYAAKWVLGLLLVLLKRRMLPAVSSSEQQIYHSMHNCSKENSEFYQIMLRPVMKQIVVSLFLGFLDGVQEVACLSVGILSYMQDQLFNFMKPTQHSSSKEDSFSDITCVLPCIHVPLCDRFKGPTSSILKDMPKNFALLKFVVAREHIISGPGKYGLDTTNIPLHERFQKSSRMKKVFSSVQETDTVKCLKVACMVFIAFYLSIFFSVIKNTK